MHLLCMHIHKPVFGCLATRPSNIPSCRWPGGPKNQIKTHLNEKQKRSGPDVQRVQETRAGKYACRSQHKRRHQRPTLKSQCLPNTQTRAQHTENKHSAQCSAQQHTMTTTTTTCSRTCRTSIMIGKQQMRMQRDTRGESDFVDGRRLCRLVYEVDHTVWNIANHP